MIRLFKIKIYGVITLADLRCEVVKLYSKRKQKFKLKYKSPVGLSELFASENLEDFDEKRN